MTVVPWQSEDPPLSPWNPSAQDIIMWCEVAGGVLLVCILAGCCFVTIQTSGERQWAQKILDEDERHLLAASKATMRANH